MDDPDSNLPLYFAGEPPVGFGDPLWFNPKVWEPGRAREYDPPHDEETNYQTAPPP